MKHYLFTLALIFISLNAFSQAGIRIFTKLEEAKFKICLDGELENTIRIKDIRYDSLDYQKMHRVVLSFSGDSIADIDEEIELLENQVRVFEILKKKSGRKKASKVGRAIGKLFKVGNHDKDEILYDIYYLEDRTKSKYLNN